MRSGESKEGVGAGLRLLAKAEDIIGATPAASAALRLDAGCVYHIVQVAMKEYCFV